MLLVDQYGREIAPPRPLPSRNMRGETGEQMRARWKRETRIFIVLVIAVIAVTCFAILKANTWI